jgi:hypothetical protein
VTVEYDDHEPGALSFGGVRTMLVYMDLEAWVEVDKDKATGVLITEYDADGKQLAETVMVLDR